MLSSQQVVYLGFMATAVNAISQLPQVLVTFKTTNLEAVSITTNILLFVAQCLWFIYAVYVKSTPLMVSATMTGILCLIIIVRVWRIRRSTSHDNEMLSEFGLEMDML